MQGSSEKGLHLIQYGGRKRDKKMALSHFSRFITRKHMTIAVLLVQSSFVMILPRL
jgi:hypothetical protein